MTVEEAERAFREQLPCETIAPEINTMKVRKFEKPTGLLIERHESELTKVFLIFAAGENSVTRYQIELIKLADSC